MIIVNKDGSVHFSQNKLLGYVGEHKPRTIEIFYPEFKNAQYRLYFNMGNPDPYMIDIIEKSFKPDNSILSAAGYIEMQFCAYQNEDMVFKSEVFKMEIGKSINGTPKACPTYEQSEDIFNKIKNATVNTPKIVESNWHTYDALSGKYVNTGIKAVGSDGFSPEIKENTNTPTEYRLEITGKESSFITPNLKGNGGSGGAVNSVNGLSGDVILTADDISFADGQNFQQKFDNGSLKGDKGNDGTNGKDYIITENDYNSIATVVLTKLTDAEGVKY